MGDKPNNPQAFPHPALANEGFMPSDDHFDGMTLRDYFAGNCPLTYSEAWEIWTATRKFTDLRAEGERNNFMMFYSDLRGEYADAMLKERAK